MTKGVIISRRVMMDLAKCIRNQDKVHHEYRLMIGKAIADYMSREYPMFDRAVFLQVLTGDMAYDPKTERYTRVPTKFGDKT